MDLKECFNSLENDVQAKLRDKNNIDKISNQKNQESKPEQSKDFNENLTDLFESTEKIKNHFYFENLSDDEFFDVSGAKNDFVSFYKKIIKSGVGSVIFGGIYLGLNQKYPNNIARISLEENIMSQYKKINQFAHYFKCKTYLKIKSVYGRYNSFYNNRNNLKIASNYGLDPENHQQLLIRISDNKCSEMTNDLAQSVMLANIAGFDGVMIDASFYNIIGELSSSEFNKRVFGYYSATNDFLKKCLKAIDAKNNSIILKISLLSLFTKEKENANLIKINQNINAERLICNLKEYVKLGVDSFEFVFGVKENEFLNAFNDHEDELLFKNFIVSIRNYFNENNIKNKFGEEVEIFYHDKADEFASINQLVKENVINYFDITRNIYSDNNFLKNLIYKNNCLKCINCSYCNEKMQNNNKIDCLINPLLTEFNNKIISRENNIVAVIGSGVSGLTCALTLVERGYIVHIFEQKDTINFYGKLTTVFGFEKSLAGYYYYLEAKINDYVKKKRIVLNLNTKFSYDQEQCKAYYSIIVATGFKSKFLSISGAILPSVHNIYDVLSNKNLLERKEKIVIYAKTELSLKLALWLSLNNKNVTLIIKNLDYFKINKNANLIYFIWNLHKNKVNILYFAKIIKINEDNLDIIFCKNLPNNAVDTYLKIMANGKLNLDKRQINIDCDLLVYEPDTVPNNSLYIDIVNNKYRGEVYLIGNALENSDLNSCIKSGYFVGKNL